MRVDPSRFVVGDIWAYRARDTAGSERVRIETVTVNKHSVRVQITFPDQPQRPPEDIPATRLRVPWDQVETYDARMSEWQRIDNGDLDDIEDSCVSHVFELLIPPSVAEPQWSPVKQALAIQDLPALTDLVGMTAEQLLATGEWFDNDGTIMLSPIGTLALAQQACRHRPMPILDWIIEQETEHRHRCKHGTERKSPRSGEMEHTSPEWEYRFYRQYYRPQLELLRQWCGHRAVTFQERLIAAEAETRRLDLLVTELIEALERAGDTLGAERFYTEHEQDRITAETSRPVVDRPLDPSEIPVREITVRRRRWW